MTARVAVLVIVWVVALGLAGCTDPSDSVAPPSSSASGPTAPERPKDRDEDALLGALRRIDLCAVLEAAATTASAMPAGTEPRAQQPFTCAMEDPPEQITTRFVHHIRGDRVVLPTRPIGGAKAYVREGGGDCAVLFPVSFEWAIEFSHSGHGESEPCRVVTELAASSTAVLADPGAVLVDPRWDACTLLAEALASEVDRSKLLASELDNCGYIAESRENRVSISFIEPRFPPGQSEFATVGGKRVQIHEDERVDRPCVLSWRQRPFPSRYARTPDFPVTVDGFDCDGVRELAESVMNVLAERPPAGVAAQHPLLYAPDEPDGPYPGACANIEDESIARDCEPYREVPVPDDVVGARHDGHAMCAVSVDAVGEAFGQRLDPVAVSDSEAGCYFVEAERTVQVRFGVAPALGRGAPDEREVTIAGHPGFVEDGGTFRQYRLSTSDTFDEDATVVLRVSTGPVIAPDLPLPAGTDRKAEAVIADVLRTYFS